MQDIIYIMNYIGNRPWLAVLVCVGSAAIGLLGAWIQYLIHVRIERRRALRNNVWYVSPSGLYQKNRRDR